MCDCVGLVYVGSRCVHPTAIDQSTNQSLTHRHINTQKQSQNQTTTDLELLRRALDDALPLRVELPTLRLLGPLLGHRHALDALLVLGALRVGRWDLWVGWVVSQVGPVSVEWGWVRRGAPDADQPLTHTHTYTHITTPTCLEDPMDVDAGEVDLVRVELPRLQQLLHLQKV